MSRNPVIEKEFEPEALEVDGELISSTSLGIVILNIRENNITYKGIFWVRRCEFIYSDHVNSLIDISCIRNIDKNKVNRRE